jgi:hypothetical protein
MALIHGVGRLTGAANGRKWRRNGKLFATIVQVPSQTLYTKSSRIAMNGTEPLSDIHHVITSHTNESSPVAVLTAASGNISAPRPRPSVELVLLSVLVVLQKDFDFVVHFRANVVAEAAGNNGQDTKAERTESCCS